MNTEKPLVTPTEAPEETVDDYPEFNPDGAQEFIEKESIGVEQLFKINPDDYRIFSKQGGIRPKQYGGGLEARTLSIHETLGLMVGRTAEMVSVITGEDGGTPFDHVIYLDKSARPVSWLVDEFWDDFTDSEQPSKSFLAIDRRVWLRKMGMNLLTNEYVEESNGSTHVAGPSDVDEYFGNIDKETLARIRALYIEGGIETEDPEEIFNTPTVLDGKNLLIVDEVQRSGSTLYIAKKLLKAAIPELKSVDGHVFWTDTTRFLDNGEQQMGLTPVWYPEDHSDWTGRGVKDINPAYFENQFNNDPTPQNRAYKFGAIVLGEPLIHPEDEPGQPSWHLREEIHRMHEDYDAGHILPQLTWKAPEKLYEEMQKRGVEFIPAAEAKSHPNSYLSLVEKRDKI